MIDPSEVSGDEEFAVRFGRDFIIWAHRVD